MINVRELEMRLNKGFETGSTLELIKEKLEKAEKMDCRVDVWDLENNDGTYGTDVVITKEGDIELCVRIMKKYSSKITYIKVGMFNPEFGTGMVYLPNGKEKEYKKFGNVINCLNKKYESYGFYFGVDGYAKEKMIEQAKRNFYYMYACDGKNPIEDTFEKEVEVQEPEVVEVQEPEVAPETEKKSGFEVRVVKISTGDAVQIMDAPNMRMAEKIERGVLINLNTEDYYVEIVDLSQSKTPEKEEIVIEKRVEKMEEREMKTINKNGLNNRMVKLGEFLKENRDKDAIENKVYELFPNAEELQIFAEDDNVVYFLVGQEYTGKAPSKKEMKEKDWAFKEVDRMYGLSVYVSVETYKIKMSADIGVDYTNEYGHSEFTDYTLKEIEIELEVTMEMAKEFKEELRKEHDDKRISATYAWEQIEKFTKKEMSDEVFDFLIEELSYYAYKEKEEKEMENVETIDSTIKRVHYLFAQGTLSVEKAIERIKRLYGCCHNEELTKEVDTALALYKKAEDIMWRDVVRKQVLEILEKRTQESVQKKIEKLEKAVTSEMTLQDAKKILREFNPFLQVEWDDEFGFCITTNPMKNICFGVGNVEEYCDYEKIIGTVNLKYGIEWVKANNKILIFVKGDVVYQSEGQVFIEKDRCIFYKEIEINTDPEKEIQDVFKVEKRELCLDSIEESGDAPQEKENIKEELKYVYSKLDDMINLKKVFVLTYENQIELFWGYDDAHNRMVELAKETAKEWGYENKLVINDYSANVDLFKWNIAEKNIQ